jgi:hypothetical protein
MLTHDARAVPWIVDAVRRAALPDAVDGLRDISLTRSNANAGLVGAAALALEDDRAQHERRITT